MWLTRVDRPAVPPDGAHHKQWLLDQAVRALTAHKYEQWVEEYESEGSEWDRGIAP